MEGLYINFHRYGASLLYPIRPRVQCEEREKSWMTVIALWKPGLMLGRRGHQGGLKEHNAECPQVQVG